MTANIFHFQLAPWSFTVIQDGATTLPFTGFFGEESVVKLPADLSEHGLEGDGLPLSINLLLASDGNEQILVDTGVGRDVGDGEGQVAASLGVLGIEPQTITAVIITHGHWDHIGGLTTEDGRLQFPQARTFMPRSEWEFWTSESELARQLEIYEQWARENLPPLQNRIELVAENDEILPGVTAVPAAGHTLGQIGLRFEGEAQQLLHLSDVAHHPLQIAHPDLTPAVDMLPEVSTATRHRLLAQAAAEKNLVLGYHFPFPGVGQVTGSGSAWQWQPLSG